MQNQTDERGPGEGGEWIRIQEVSGERESSTNNRRTDRPSLLPQKREEEGENSNSWSGKTRKEEMSAVTGFRQLTCAVEAFQLSSKAENLSRGGRTEGGSVDIFGMTALHAPSDEAEVYQPGRNRENALWNQKNHI